MGNTLASLQLAQRAFLPSPLWFGFGWSVNSAEVAGFRTASGLSLFSSWPIITLWVWACALGRSSQSSSQARRRSSRFSQRKQCTSLGVAATRALTSEMRNALQFASGQNPCESLDSVSLGVVFFSSEQEGTFLMPAPFRPLLPFPFPYVCMRMCVCHG